LIVDNFVAIQIAHVRLNLSTTFFQFRRRTQRAPFSCSVHCPFWLLGGDELRIHSATHSPLLGRQCKCVTIGKNGQTPSPARRISSALDLESAAVAFQPPVFADGFVDFFAVATRRMFII
jgi:hypothetical protein